MWDDLFPIPDGKTNYQIRNESGEKTTVTLDKWVADILQIELDDVHSSIQKAYDKITTEHSHLSRRERGNEIRKAAVKEANQYQETKKKILGWNDDDILSLF